MPKNLLHSKLGLNLNLTPALKKSIALLPMSYTDILIEINQSLEKNMMLVKSSTESKNDSYLKYDKQNTTYHKQIEHNESLYLNLEAQTTNSSLNTREMAIAKVIIENINENGFLEISIDTVSRICQNKNTKISNINIDICERIRKYIQNNFEPFGIASFNMQEFLLIQIKKNKNINDNSVIHKLLLNEIDITQVTAEQKKFFISILKLLLKTPVDNIDDKFQEQYIQTDLTIKKDAKGWNVTIKDLPSLTINKEYLSLRTSLKEKLLFDNHLSKARGLISFLKYRKQLLQIISMELIKIQKKALIKGLKYLKPLTQKQLANELDIGESTLSRIIKNKYAMTPMGVIKIKDLFSPNINNYASKSIQQMINEIINNENKTLSDQNITDILIQRKINICRRTVTKYRKLLNIPCARNRK